MKFRYQSEKVWNLSDILFKLFSFSFLSGTIILGYNGNMTSQRVCSSHHIAINSSLSLILFNFADIFILRDIKVVQSLVFLLCNISTFDVCFFKKCVQISHVSMIRTAVSDNNSKKLDESWTRPTILQLNGCGEFFKIHDSSFTFPFNWIQLNG